MHVIDATRTISYFALLLLCAYTDYKKGKIFNKYLICYLAVFALIYIIGYIAFTLFANDDMFLLNDRLKDNALGFLIGLLVGFIFYALGIFKGGDGKLFAVVGLTSGMSHFATHFAIIFIISGVAALYVMVKNKVLINKFKRIWLYLKGLILTFKYNRYEIEEGDTIKFPFALYVFLGEIVSYLYLYIYLRS